MYAPGSSLAIIRREQGADTAAQVIVREIVKVFEFYGVEVKMGQLRLSADIILSEFYFLKPDEIEFAFRKGMSGRYTRVFGKFNPSFLVEWLNAYLEDRHTTAETHSLNAHARLKAGTAATAESGNAVFMPDMVRALSERLEADADERLAAVTPPLGFNSIEDAVKHYGIDPTEAKRILEELWDSDWKRVKTEQPDIEQTGMTADVFRIYCYNKFLNALNETA